MGVAACGGDNSAPAVGTTVPARTTTTVGASTTTVARTTTSARPATTTSGPTTSAGGATTAPPTTVASDRCHTNELQASAGPPNPGAGQVYVPLILKNVGSRQCSVAGYPGVSLLDASGAQIQQPATRETGFPSNAVKLAPGATASAALHTIDAGIAPGGCWPTSTSVKVFPPNELDSLTAPLKLTVCGNMFSVRPLVAGSNG
jgi:hypothetical protein